MDTRNGITYIEFYVTNHCNLNCDNCNRFNNYKFTGHFNLDPYKETYLKWSKLLAPTTISILGGEPLMNPRCLEWVEFVRSLWPDANLGVVTNGTFLNKTKGLYTALKENNAYIEVNVHNYNLYDTIIHELDRFYPGEYSLDQHDFGDIGTFDVFANDGSVEVQIYKATSQHEVSVHLDHGKLTIPYNSDPDIAHSNCDMKNCHHFYNGKLYKCGTELLLGQFTDQHSVDYNTTDHSLIKQDTGITVEQWIDNPEQCFSRLSNSIDQCKFCPETYDNYQYVSASVGNTKIDQ